MIDKDSEIERLTAQNEFLKTKLKQAVDGYITNDPIVNRIINARANSIGVSNVIEPFHMVATQLNTFTPVGTAINIVVNMKNISPASGMPTVNI